MTARLQGRTALVTGSTDGVGVGIARALAHEGAFVVVSGRNAARGEKVVAEIAERGGAAAFVGADLAGGLAAARALADAAQAAAGGPIDILVNNAAMLIAPGPTAEIGEELIDGALAVNVKSVMLLTGVIAPGMAARGNGAIVNVGSINGLVGMGGSALYSATKAAIHSLTKSWAAEYGPSGVRVNTVAPGPTLTERNAAFADRIAPIVGRAPSRRMGTTGEVGRVVAFLASDDASHVHGATLSVDGGLSAV
ncbi:MAG TPA: SDR family oxidoreductase [Trebonia sp.]|nr:SDR family oxidoreductase [Trebonia sp.]